MSSGNAAYHDHLGTALFAQEEYAEAEAAFREAVRLDPGDAAYHDDLGGALFNREEYAEAEAAFREAVRLDPGNVGYHDDLKDALSAHKINAEAVQPKPGDTDYREHVGRVPARAGDLDDLLKQLDALTGLAPVKAQVHSLIALVRTSKERQAAGLPVSEVSQHLVFTGSPGTGKTTVARLLGQLYAAIGVLETGRLVEVTRSDLVAGYLGQTAIKTTKAVKRALGGILFIDEAYALTRSAGQGDDFGQEAVDTLVKLMEDHRDELVVIAAGYTDEMAQFITANPGLQSRFPRTIDFPDYNADELLSIFKGMCEHYRYEVTTGALDGLRQYLAKLPRTEGFGNGRLVRNLFEAALARQASRIVASGGTNPTYLTPADLDLGHVIPDDALDPRSTGPYL